MLEKQARDSLVGMTGSFIAWSIYFVAMYAFLSVGCITGWDRARVLGTDAVRLGLIATTVVTLLVIGYFGWRGLVALRYEYASPATPEPVAHRPFVAQMTVLLAGLALLSTLWVGAPMLLLTPCS